MPTKGGHIIYKMRCKLKSEFKQERSIRVSKLNHLNRQYPKKSVNYF